MRFKRKKQKKKQKTVTIWLKKDEENQQFQMKVGKRLGMLKIAKKLISMGRKGWQLYDITGDPETVGMFKGILDGYQAGDDVPIKKMVKTAGLKSTPGFIKKLIKKDKEVNDHGAK